LRKFTSLIRSSTMPPSHAPIIASGAAAAKNHQGGRPVCAAPSIGAP
jgi:hypothetical protein